MHTVISYDVCETPRRSRLHKLLRGHLRWVQLSVFEGHLPAGKLDALRGRIQQLIDPGRDSVRIYPMCRRCRGAIDLLGVAEPTPEGPEDVII